MPESAARTPTSSGHRFGTLLCRAIVPLWVLAGASFKLYEQNPGNLPIVIRELSKSIGYTNLDQLMHVLIGCELFAAGVMIFVPRLARAMAVFMLACFCAILAAEMYRGATSCGCFGKLPFKPWHMLTIDGSMLILTLLFRPLRSAAPSTSMGGSLVAASVIAVVGMGVAFAVPKPADIEQQVARHDPPVSPTTATAPTSKPDPADSQPATTPVDLPPTVNPHPKALPSSWYTKEKPDTWVGKPWRDLDIFQLMPTWPKDMDRGKRYVIFYSRTCEHCKAMLEEDLLAPLDGLITLVQVPASRTVLTDPDAWPLPESVNTILHAELLDLPLGPNWLIETPMVVAVQDGKVTCAAEGEHKRCLGLQ